MKENNGFTGNSNTYPCNNITEIVDLQASIQAHSSVMY